MFFKAIEIQFPKVSETNTAFDYGTPIWYKLVKVGEIW